MDASQARHIGAVCLGLQVRRAARQVGRRYDMALQPHGLTIGQFSLLTMLAAQSRWSMQSLADALGTDRSSLTAALKPLERRGLVVSATDKGDRRLRFPALTATGAALIADATESWRLVQEELEARLAPDDMKALGASLLALS